MTYILHHMPGSRSVRVLWLMEEMGLDYELKIRSRDGLKAADYLVTAPLGKVPALETDGQVIIESGAIIQYLLAKHSPTALQLEPSAPNFGAYLQWLHFPEGTLMPALSGYFLATVMKPEAQRVQTEIDAALERLQAPNAFIGDALKKSAYIAGDHFTAADIMLGYSLHIASRYGALQGAPQALQDYVTRITERPAFGRAAFSGQ